MRKLGGDIILQGATFDEAYEVAQTLVTRHDHTMIHPFDDPLVIAGMFWPQRC